MDRERKTESEVFPRPETPEDELRAVIPDAEIQPDSYHDSTRSTPPGKFEWQPTPESEKPIEHSVPVVDRPKTPEQMTQALEEMISGGLSDPSLGIEALQQIQEKNTNDELPKE